MSQLPRVALGTVQANVDRRPVLWALMDIARRRGQRVQTFLSQARFDCCDGSAYLTGENPRYLDSWLMSREVCLELFQHGTRACDFAIVEGAFDSGDPPATYSPSKLETLCDWLDLPSLVVLDATRMDPCRLPARPEFVDAVLLTGIRDDDEASRWRVNLETHWRVPVVGSLLATASVRQAIDGIPFGQAPSREVCRMLGDRLSRRLRWQRLSQIAAERELPPANQLAHCSQRSRPLNVAIAYDDAFNCYFQEVSDLLELRGARIEDFSPIRSEQLPVGTDVVLFGCGNAAQHAEALARNHCLKQSLRNHVARGGRVYAEGSGLAYLGQEMITPDGRSFPMADVLPIVAVREADNHPTQAVEVTVAGDNWLASARTRLRGYRNSNWRIEPSPLLPSFAMEPDCVTDLVGYHNVVGSLVHLNFAAEQTLLDHFFEPNRPARVSTFA